MFDASWGFYFDSLTVVMLSCHALPPKKPEKFCFVAWPRSSSTHAGVPLKRPIAGVAMGLILEADGRFCVLTDILGSEDALGDMDFKVAGDAEGVTAFQMDIKVGRVVQLLCQSQAGEPQRVADGSMHMQWMMNLCHCQKR